MGEEPPPPSLLQPPADPGQTARRRDILERLNQGEITVADAADLLSQP